MRATEWKGHPGIEDYRKGGLIGDLVLVHYQDRPTVYARIEAVEPDVKKDWYQATLLLLTIPAKQVTWILRAEYIQGAPFTMGGQAMKLEPVRALRPVDRSHREPDGPKSEGKTTKAKVIPLKRQD